MPSIHPLSSVHPDAIVDPGVEIGPFSVVGPDVRLRSGVKIHSHAVIEGQTEIGSGTEVYPFATVGCIPQDLKYKGEATRLEIGKNNIIREQVSIHLGTLQGGGLTKVGNNNLFMVGVHIAHDCQIGNDLVIANGVAVGGHVRLHDGVVIGGLCGIHQFVQVGKLAMVAAGSMVSQDVLPFSLVHGDRARLVGANRTGLRRSSVSEDEQRQIRQFYRRIAKTGMGSRQDLRQLVGDFGSQPWTDCLAQFLESSTRGLCPVGQE